MNLLHKSSTQLALTVLSIACLVGFIFIREIQFQFILLGLAAVFFALRLYSYAPTDDKQGARLSFWQSPVPWLLVVFLLFIAGMLSS